MARFLALLLFIASASFVAAFTALPNEQLHCGKITEFRFLDAADVDWTAWDTIAYGPAPTLEDGERYALIVVTLSKNRAISKYDFTLDNAACLAIAKENESYDPKLRIIPFINENTRINLLFKIEENAEDAYLFRMALTDRHQPTQLSIRDNADFQDGALDDAAAPAPDAAAPDAADPAAAPAVDPGAAVPAPAVPAALPDPVPAAPAAPAANTVDDELDLDFD